MDGWMVEGFIIILNSWEMPWFIWPLDLCCDGRALLAPDLDHHRKVVYYTTTTFSSSSSSVYTSSGRRNNPSKIKVELGERTKKCLLFFLFRRSFVIRMCPPHSSVPFFFWTSLSFLHNKRTRLLVSYTGETILFSRLPRVCHFSLTSLRGRVYATNIIILSDLNKQGGHASGGDHRKLSLIFINFNFQRRIQIK